MSRTTHQFEVHVKWEEAARGYMNHDDKEDLLFSSPRAFSGEDVGLSPEHMFVGSISSCHMLTFLFFLKKADVTLKSYRTDAVGTVEKGSQGFSFSKVTLTTMATVGVGERGRTISALEKGHKYCLVTNSVKCPIETVFEVKEE